MFLGDFSTWKFWSRTERLATAKLWFISFKLDTCIRYIFKECKNRLNLIGSLLLLFLFLNIFLSVFENHRLCSQDWPRVQIPSRRSITLYITFVRHCSWRFCTRKLFVWFATDWTSTFTLTSTLLESVWQFRTGGMHYSCLFFSINFAIYNAITIDTIAENSRAKIQDPSLDTSWQFKSTNTIQPGHWQWFTYLRWGARFVLLVFGIKLESYRKFAFVMLSGSSHCRQSDPIESAVVGMPACPHDLRKNEKSTQRAEARTPGNAERRRV